MHTFALTSEDERGSAACADELFADLFWRGGKVCCVSQTRLAFFDDNAKLTAEYPFGDLYLYDYAAEGDEMCIRDRDHGVLAAARHVHGGLAVIAHVHLIALVFEVEFDALRCV